MSVAGDKAKIVRYIEENQAEMIRFLQQLTQIPSDNPPGDCRNIAHFIEQRLREFDFADTSYLELPPDEAARMSQIAGVNVVASTVFGSAEGLEIALNAHGDVVPPGLGWTYDPYGGDLVDGRIYGRGAAVSKSDIAAYTFAVMALRENFSHLHGRAVLVFNFDEETGGVIGPKWLLEHGVISPDFAISAGFTHAIVNAHNGCLHLEVKIVGRSAHAAVPHTGCDALEAMTGVLNALYAYRKTLADRRSLVAGIDAPTLVVGLIRGGINTNVVPDECVIRLDRRIIPEEDVREVEDELRTLIERSIETYEGVTVYVTRVLLANKLGPLEADSPLVGTLATNWRAVMGGDAPIGGVPLYTDARHFTEYGVPVVMFGAGPRTLEEANGHCANEHVKVQDLVRAAKIVACTLYDLFSTLGDISETPAPSRS